MVPQLIAVFRSSSRDCRVAGRVEFGMVTDLIRFFQLWQRLSIMAKGNESDGSSESAFINPPTSNIRTAGMSFHVLAIKEF